MGRILIVEMISDFAASSQLPLLSLSHLLKVIKKKKHISAISGSLSLFQFCFIESKIPIALTSP